MVTNNIKRSNLKTIVIGCTPLAQKITHTLKEISNLVGVVNLEPSAAINKCNYCSTIGHNELTHWTQDINSKQTKCWIQSLSPDIIIQCGWSQIFNQDILQIPKKYCLGIHPSPLPMGRGAAILNWKIIESNGKNIDWGNSIFVMEKQTDVGDIIALKNFTIETRDNIQTVYDKVCSTSVDMIKEVIKDIDNNTELLIKQDDDLADRYYKRKPEDGMIDINWSSIKINDYIRALTHPFPGAFLNSSIGKLTFWKSKILSSNEIAEPGTIMSISSKGLRLKCGNNTDILIQRVSIDNIEYWADEFMSVSKLKIGQNIL
tara:strand:+ start:7212 stop:8162 length:951 start_codon:yes stop_codon:yes gene_type:complete